MMKNKALLLGGVVIAFGFLVGCKSNLEAAGDKFRKGGDPLNALMQYEEALRRGKISKEFWDNYALVNIQAMAMRAKEDPTAEFLDILKDTVISVLTQHPNPANEALLAQTLFDIGMARINMGGARAEEGGMSLLKAAESLPNKGGDISAKVEQAREALVTKALAEVREEMSNGEPTSGIVADYKMRELKLKIGGETEAMKSLWSEIRKKTLNTYLMYDLEGLLPESPDARINEYALLLGIVKFDRSGSSVKIQVKLFNGAGFSVPFDGKAFTLYDKAGNAYQPSSVIGAAAKKVMVGSKDESKTGGVNFTVPADAELDHLEFKADRMTTRKYLP
jgi:hypothetical protein